MTKLWEKRAIGKPPKFTSPEDMWQKAIEYFEWCDKSQLEESKVFCFQGEIVKDGAKKMRAMSHAGLCSFLNIGQSTWYDYCNKEQYSEVTEAINTIMYEQKFSGAAAGLLSSNIIARDLGLVDKRESENKNVELSHEEWLESLK
ncbi:MAG: terminase small subunit [Pseudomonadota bacterium]